MNIFENDLKKMNILKLVSKKNDTKKMNIFENGRKKMNILKPASKKMMQKRRIFETGFKKMIGKR